LGNPVTLSPAVEHAIAYPLEVVLSVQGSQSGLAGYSFSDDQILPWGHKDVDVQFGVKGGVPYLMAAGDCRIRGFDTTSIAGDTEEISSGQWAPDRREPAIAGQGYVMRLWDRTLVRLMVTTVSRNSVSFEWLPLGKAPLGDEVIFSQ
jgi:hypothetical protein